MSVHQEPIPQPGFPDSTVLERPERPSRESPGAGDVLLVTTDPGLTDDVLRLAAVVGCGVRPVSESAPVEWATAPLILLDEQAALATAGARLPRRAGVLIVCTQPPQGPVWRAAFELGAERAVHLPAEESELAALLADVVETPATRTGRVIAFVGGCGGAGASVLATATAVTAARHGESSLLLDCDSVGGGLDLLAGTEAVGGLRWSELTVTSGRVGASALRGALPTRRVGSGSVAVLPCDRDGRSSGLTDEAVRAVVEAGRRAGDTVVCDLPRALPAPAVAAVQNADLVTVVVPAQVRACAAAAVVARAVRQHAKRVCAVVRGPAPSGLRMPDVEQAVGVEAIAALRWLPGLGLDLDRGGLCSGRFGVRGPLARVASGLLRTLDEDVSCAVDESVVALG